MSIDSVCAVQKSRTDGGLVLYSFGGLWPGYRSHVTLYVATGITIAVQTNRDGRLDIESLVTRIAASVPAM